MPGLFDGRHEFLLAALPDGGTRLTHRERFTGALTVFGGAMFDRTRAGFEAFNTAFKARCEQPSMVDGR